MFFNPKMAKMAKTRIFPDTTLPFDDSKQLSPVSDQVLDKSDERFRKKCQKTWFLSENGQIFDFFDRTKIVIDHFQTIILA